MTEDPAVWITRVPAARSGQSFAVKDNIDVAGVPTTAGCPGFAYTPDRTAPAVQRLLDAGAVLLGKTNLDQFATGLVGTRSPYGIPRNIRDPRLIPGGSSSGSAVAVAAGLVDFALGTDTAGSGRVPAALNGIVGFKPTIGSVSTGGMVPACRSIDTISVFARSVDAAHGVLTIMAGYDAADPYSRAAPFPHLRRPALPPVLRFAIADEAGLCTPPIADAYARACAGLATQTIDLGPFLHVARLLYDGPWVAERTAALRDVIERRPDILHPVTRAVLETGLDRRTVDAFDAFHALAGTRRIAAELFSRVDALLLPTVPCHPTLDDVAADPIGVNARLGTFTNFVNLCDLAAITLPSGLMVIGPAWSDGRLAAIAGHLAGEPSAAADAPAAEETALFCVGAHMSGLPLNPQIRELGGRFLRTAATAPRYRLFALGRRPGLVRAEPGAAITGEVWALPTAAIGALLGAVPSPLGFGRVELAEGPCLGFLAEQAGVTDAPDITQHGGWRAWLAAQA